MKNLLLFTLFIFAFLAKPLVCFADSDNPPKPINLDEKPIKDPTKIKSPSLLRLAAYTNGNTVVVTSNVDIMAHVLIYDAASYYSYYNSAVALTPQCRCQIASTEGVLTIQIIVGDTIFEGKFSL